MGANFQILKSYYMRKQKTLGKEMMEYESKKKGRERRWCIMRVYGVN